MSPAEEQELAEHARAGDESAFCALVSRYESYAYVIARKMGDPDLTEELVQVFNITLLRALQSWNSSGGRTLLSYTAMLAKQEMRRTLHQISCIVGGGQQHFKRCRQARKALRSGRGLTSQERAAVAAAIPGEPIEDHAVELQSAEDRILARRAVERLLDQLSERDRLAVELRFGLNGHPEHTLAEVGEQLGIGESGVGMLLSRAMARLRSPVKPCTRRRNSRRRAARGTRGGQVNEHTQPAEAA